MRRTSSAMDTLSSTTVSGDPVVPTELKPTRRVRRTEVTAPSRGEGKTKTKKTASDTVPVRADGTLYEHRWYTARGRRVFVYANKTYKGKSAHTMWEAVKRKSTLLAATSPPIFASSALLSSSHERNKTGEEEEERKTKKGKKAENARKSDTTRERKSERSTVQRRSTASKANTLPPSSSRRNDLASSCSRGASSIPSSSLSSSLLQSSVPTAVKWSPSLRSRFAAEEAVAGDTAPLQVSLPVDGFAENRPGDSLEAFIRLPDAFYTTPSPLQTTSPLSLPKAEAPRTTLSSISGSSHRGWERESPKAIPFHAGEEEDSGAGSQRQAEAIVVSSSSDSDTEQEATTSGDEDVHATQWSVPPPAARTPVTSLHPSSPPQEGKGTVSRCRLVLPKTSYFDSEEEADDIGLSVAPQDLTLSHFRSLVDSKEVTPRRNEAESLDTHAGDFPVRRPPTVSLGTTTGAPLSAVETASSLADTFESPTHFQDGREWSGRRDGHESIADGFGAPLQKRVEEIHLVEDVSWRHRPSSAVAASLSLSSRGGHDTEWSLLSSSEARVEPSAHAAGLQFIGVSGAALPSDAPSLTTPLTTVFVKDGKRRKGKHQVSMTFPAPSLLVPPVTAVDGSYADCLTFDALEGMNLEGMLDIGEEIGALRFCGADA